MWVLFSLLWLKEGTLQGSAKKKLDKLQSGSLSQELCPEANARQRENGCLDLCVVVMPKGVRNSLTLGGVR